MWEADQIWSGMTVLRLDRGIIYFYNKNKYDCRETCNEKLEIKKETLVDLGGTTEKI